MIRRPHFYMRRMSSVDTRFKMDRRMNDGTSIGSSDALGFGYSMGQGSALKHRTIRRLDHRFIRWLHLNHTETRQLNCFSIGWTDAWIEDSAVHPTVIFKSHSTTPSVESSAPDDTTGCRCIASVHCLGFLVQRLYWLLWDTGWSDASQGETIGSSDGTTFLGNLFQRLASLARTINMTPCLPWADFAILKIHCSQGEKESVFLPFGILFLLFEGLFLSDQKFSRCIHGLAECSGQVKVCGLVTLGVWRLLNGLSVWRVLGELLEIVWASIQAWCTRFETHHSGDEERVLLVSTCVLVTQGGAIL
jgi:hypothetical protein